MVFTNFPLLQTPSLSDLSKNSLKLKKEESSKNGTDSANNNNNIIDILMGRPYWLVGAERDSGKMEANPHLKQKFSIAMKSELGKLKWQPVRSTSHDANKSTLVTKTTDHKIKCVGEIKNGCRENKNRSRRREVRRNGKENSASGIVTHIAATQQPVTTTYALQESHRKHLKRIYDYAKQIDLVLFCVYLHFPTDITIIEIGWGKVLSDHLFELKPPARTFSFSLTRHTHTYFFIAIVYILTTHTYIASVYVSHACITYIDARMSW